MVTSARALAKRVFGRSLQERHGYLYLVAEYLKGSHAGNMDILQGAYGAPPLKDPQILRQTVSMADLQAAGAEHWRVREGYPMPDLEPRVFPPSARGAVPTLKGAVARPIDVTKLHNVLVADPFGWVRTEGGRWITDSFPCTSVHFLAGFEGMNAWAQKPARTLNGVTALLTSENGTNYYHWLHQITAQIDAIRSVIPDSQIDRWLVRDVGPAFVREILAKLGIDLAKVDEAKEMPAACETLVVATFPSMGALDYADGWPLNLVRDLFAPKAEIEPFRRVYLRRGRNDTRPTLNVEAVDDLMQKLGFETQTMDGLTVAEQARLMAETKTLVAPHGAALANIVFCAPGTRMIETLPLQWPSPLYGMVSETCGLRHAFVPGIEATLPWLGVRHGGAATKVPIDALADAIRTLESEP